MVSDRRMRKLSDSDRWVWVGILIVAKLADAGGDLLLADGSRVGAEDISDIIASDFDVVKESIKTLKSAGLLVEKRGLLSVPTWQDRQYESDNVTARVQKHRANRNRNGKETLQNVTSNEIETPPDTEYREQNPETDKKKKRSLAIVGGGARNGSKREKLDDLANGYNCGDTVEKLATHMREENKSLDLIDEPDLRAAIQKEWDK